MSEQHYKVRWTIDVWADSPEEAARRAREYQGPDTSALFFQVRDVLSDRRFDVDLEEGTIFETESDE